MISITGFDFCGIISSTLRSGYSMKKIKICKNKSYPEHTMRASKTYQDIKLLYDCSCIVSGTRKNK